MQEKYVLDCYETENDTLQLEYYFNRKHEFS